MDKVYFAFRKFSCIVEFQTHEESVRCKHALENKTAPGGL